MVEVRQIERAIVAHAMWKYRLKEALETGDSKFQVEKVKADNLCDFGKWLYGMSEENRGEEIWARVRDRHAEFHLETARILELVLRGNREDARKEMALKSKYSKLSTGMTRLLMEWLSKSGVA